MPFLLQFKIEAYFKQLHMQGVYQDLSHFQVLEVDMREQSTLDELLTTYPDFHFFVDEVDFHEDAADGVNYNTMKYWSQKIPPDQHCWIAVCYNKNSFDRDKLLGQFPKKTGMTKAMRNNEGNVKLVKEKMYISTNLVGRSQNDTTKIGELEIPSNLTRTFPTENFLLEANNYQDGFEKVFESLKNIDDACKTSSLIVMPWANTYYCKCYKDKSPQELMAFLAPIYDNFNRPQPNVYLEKANIDQAKAWMISSSKANDLITDNFLVNGCEQPIVVVFNEKGEFHHNLAMRSTGILVVVDIPEDPWMQKCFHPVGNPDHDHYSEW